MINLIGTDHPKDVLNISTIQDRITCPVGPSHGKEGPQTETDQAPRTNHPKEIPNVPTIIDRTTC